MKRNEPRMSERVKNFKRTSKTTKGFSKDGRTYKFMFTSDMSQQIVFHRQGSNQQAFKNLQAIVYWKKFEEFSRRWIRRSLASQLGEFALWTEMATCGH